MMNIDLPISFGIFALIESLFGLLGAMFNAPMWWQYGAFIGVVIGLFGMWISFILILGRRK